MRKYIRDDIKINILSNKDFVFSKQVLSYKEFLEKKGEFDISVWINKNNFKDVEFYYKDKKLSWEEIVLNYLNFLNGFLREQIGVCIDKSIARVIDNSLTYLIIQRKNYKDFDENFFIAVDGEVIFPAIKKEFDIELALIKFVEWMKKSKKEVIFLNP